MIFAPCRADGRQSAWPGVQSCYEGWRVEDLEADMERDGGWGCVMNGSCGGRLKNPGANGIRSGVQCVRRRCGSGCKQQQNHERNKVNPFRMVVKHQMWRRCLLSDPKYQDLSLTRQIKCSEPFPS